MEASVTTLAAKLEGLHSDIGEIKSVLKGLTSAITKLALVEERQMVTNASVERAFQAIAAVEMELKESNRRLFEIEKGIPKQSQAIDWVFDAAKWCLVLILALAAKKMGLL